MIIINAPTVVPMALAIAAPTLPPTQKGRLQVIYGRAWKLETKDHGDGQTGTGPYAVRTRHPLILYLNHRDIIFGFRP